MAEDTKNATKKTDDKPAVKKAAAKPVKEEAVSKVKSEKSPSVTKIADKLPSETDTPEDNSLISQPAADAAPASSDVVAPSDPVVVPDKSVTDSGKLAEEIEVLTGEIQALEAKIEQLTNGATTAPAEPNSSDIAPINAPQASTQPPTPSSESQEPKPEVKVSSPNSAEPVKPEETTTTDEKDFVNKPQEISDNTLPKNEVNTAPKNINKFSDISAKPKSNESPTDLNPSSEDNDTDNSSGLAIIGEVIAVFGVIIFVILAISPFFKESIGDSAYEAVQQVGWLSTIGSLALGLILYMFVKGGGLFKTLIFILLLLAALLYLAISNSSLVPWLTDSLGPLIDFYR